jgi:hypothetical protein
MKIDEPKTPYVTDEEFKKLCDEDEEYQKAFGKDDDGHMQDISDNEYIKPSVNFNMKDIDVNS